MLSPLLALFVACAYDCVSFFVFNESRNLPKKISTELKSLVKHIHQLDK